MSIRRVRVVDSHTGGEPTRVVLGGGPDLGGGSVAERLARFRADHDDFRRAVVCEPRGSDILVGALLVPPTDPANASGVIFFNNVGYLGMCGHGTIGLVATLAFLGRLTPGTHALETPVGNVAATLHADGAVSVRNVASRRTVKDLTVDVPGYGPLVGDVAYGGNYFFLAQVRDLPLTVENAPALTEFAGRVRRAVNATHPEVDHVELVGPPADPANHARNFVLCPGGAYDRSPCGTGTSAKLACLHADGKLAPGDTWRQESVTGSVFVGTVEPDGAGGVLPTVTGRAHVNAEADLILDDGDPLCWGI
jgi:4-hydroxyproline epimerase